MTRFSRLVRVSGRSVATMVLAGAAGGVFIAASPAQAATALPPDGTDSSQPFSYPLTAATCSITVDARGADGGSSLGGQGVAARDAGGAPGVGGKGGHVIATLPTAPGDILKISIGGRGGDDNAGPNAAAGSPGETGGVATGGFGGSDTVASGPQYVAAGGGGMSIVELNGAAAVVAAGGGGAALITDGGNGGSPGTAGADDSPGTGGGGGTATVGGSAGGGDATAGGFGTGGNGASIGGIPGGTAEYAGGGGGSGLLGGGGGGNDGYPNQGGGAGGGGANFVASGATAVTTTTGPGGSGYVQVTLNACALPAGAPTNLTAADGDQAAVLTFGAAPANGGTITGYELSLDAGDTWAAFSVTDNLNGTFTGTKTGLTAKSTYHFKVRAQGSGGAGTPSAVLDYIAATVPTVPASLTAAPGNGQVVLTFPASDGMGRPVLRYEWRIAGPGPWTTLADTDAGGGTRTGTVTGLPNGVSTSLEVRAVNVIGPGQPSPTASATPQLPMPLAPTDLAAAPGNAQANLTFTPPVDNGGGTVLRYEYQVDGGSWTTFTTTSAGNGKLAGTVPGLTNDTTYAVRVRAVNGQGAGAEAGPASVTPVAAKPGAPTIVGHQLADGSATITFTAPADNGGAAITAYEFQLDGSSGWNSIAYAPDGGGNLVATLTPLATGTTYDVRVRAVNTSGFGASSGVETFVGVSVPAAPVLTAVAGDASAVVTFTPPAANGGTISGYEISVNDGGTWTAWSPQAVTGGKLGATVTGLLNDQTYAIRVRAVNQYGTGPRSAAAAVTPHAVPPGPPTGLSGAPGDRAVSLSFTIPADPGSSAISGYDVSTDDGATWTTLAVSGSGATRTAAVSGLDAGTIYPIRVRARNAAGPGEQSTGYTFTAVGVPAAPNLMSADPGDARAVLTFTPGSANGSPVTSYEATVDNGDTWVTLPTSDAPESALYGLLQPLTNGTPYIVKVRALNVYGPSAWSGGLAVIPAPAPPGAPGGLTVAARNAGLLVRFTPPVGDPDATYQASTDNGDTWSDLTVTAAGDALTGLLTGLTNGTPYPVRIRAVNGIAPGDPTEAVTGTPRAPAPAPLSVTVLPGISSVEVFWPASTGDNVTGYTVTASPGPAICETTTELSCVLGAVVGVTYTYSVVAHSDSGDSPVATESAPVGAAMPIPPADPPAGAFLLTTTDGAITTAEPGQEITFVGDGFAAFSTVVLSIYSDPVVLATAVTDAGGAFRRTITVPAALAAGVHTILAQGVDENGDPRYLSLAVTVAADGTATPVVPAPAGPGGTLPTTGGTPWMAALLGLLMIVLGATLRTWSAARRW